jgi:hypothetical protein
LPGRFFLFFGRHSHESMLVYGILEEIPRMEDAKFWKMVEKTSTCWLWHGCVDAAGYGNVRRQKRTLKAHRYAWQITNGIVPSGMWLLHSCNVKNCVNPAHLRIGTPQENISDTIAAGFKMFGRNRTRSG